MDIIKLGFMFAILAILAFLVVVALRQSRLEGQIKSMPEYKNMESIQEKIQAVHGDNKKIEGQLFALEKAFTELTNRVNNLPRDIKKLLEK